MSPINSSARASAAVPPGPPYTSAQEELAYVVNVKTAEIQGLHFGFERIKAAPV